MKIYFTASLRGMRQYGVFYKKIYNTIEKLGHKHLDDFLFKQDPDEFYQGDYKSRVELYKTAIKNISKADIVILEVTIPSLSIGYVMNRTLEEDKPVILLYLEDAIPFFAQGVQDEKLQVLAYTLETTEETLKYAIDIAKEQINARFTLLFPPKIIRFLTKISKKNKIPRSVFIRNLIEEKMEKER